MNDYQERLRAIIVGSHHLKRDRQVQELAKEFGMTLYQVEHDMAATAKVLEKIPTALYQCGGRACCRNRVDVPEMPGVPVIKTACLGPCKAGPVFKLEQHGDSQFFARVDTVEKADCVADFCCRARGQQTLMLNAEEAHALLLDPHHEAPQPDEIARYSFLVGCFRGQGRILGTGETFFKESEGRWEAGGRFLSLRQRAVYGDDIHTALIIISSDRALAYRDDGEERVYQPEWSPTSVSFSDMVPHRAQARDARKVITPTERGYIETLEVTTDGQTYRPYYDITHHKMERTERAHARL